MKSTSIFQLIYSLALSLTLGAAAFVPTQTMVRDYARPRLAASKGFGAASSTKSKTGTGVKLSNKAKKLLKKNSNNVDAASNEYFQSLMHDLKDRTLSSDEMHRARVAATWNTVAMFLPQDYARTKGKTEPYVERRLKHIVTACCGSNEENPINLLDVGCGDGAIVPYLPKTATYSGLDISSEMVALGVQRWPQCNFWVGSFPETVPEGTKYDVILLNGSLQFFRDTRQVLSDAAFLLKPAGRIVLSHANGAKFVKQECASNPSVAVRHMPNRITLQSISEWLQLQVRSKSDMLSAEYDAELDGDDDLFYLVALEKPE